MSDKRQRVLSAVKPQRLSRIFRDLLDIYSPSGKEEDIQLHLEELLVGAGFSVERQEVEEERYNLKVTMGQGSPRLYLVGHVDTVPAWDLEEFGAREKGETIYGLGSADMKGGCAAMVEAWLALSEGLSPRERPDVGLLLVVGEEENGDGSETFLAGEGSPSWVVIGEPTSLSACFAHYGYLETGFVTHGIKSHSSMPELGDNAVEAMLRVLLFLGKDSLFNRTESEIVYSIREMHSSRHGFVVPDRCETWIDLHLPPEKDPQLLIGSIRQIVDRARAEIAGLNVNLDFGFVSSGYHLGTNNAVARALPGIYQELGLPLKFDAFRSHSDGNLFFAAGGKPLILGPGALETAHTADEQVPFREVLAASRIYALLCLEAGRL